VLSEGWDEPSLECIVIATPTRSQVKYAQIAGRGLRTFPGKTDCLIIDVVGVTDRLDLQTLPRLFGLRAQPDPGVTVTEALDRQTADDDAAVAAAAKKAQAEWPMRSHRVSVLGPRARDRPMHWLRHDRFWLLPAGQGTILALGPMRDTTGDRWAVVRLDRDHHEILARDIDLAYAHGIAEDHIRNMGTHRLADPHATWRRKPMTDAQAQTLQRLGIPIPDQATKGDASDRIALAEGARRLQALIRQRAA
jgi:hypothetical protein